MLSFDGINLVVGDMDASVAFYRLLGLTVPDAEPDWQQHHRNVELDGGSLDLDSIVFARQWNRGWPGDATAVRGAVGVIGLRVATRDDVDALFACVVAAGHRAQQPPYDAFWGARYAVVEDPDGNAVGLMSPSDPGKRSFQGAPAA